MPVLAPPPDFAQRTARILLEIEAVLFNADKPFIFTSGWASPVYIDCRKIIAFPRARRGIIEMARQLILDRVGYESFDCIAGGETAGIAYAAWLAEAFDLPMLYVRKQPKGFGRMAQIEGDMKEGARVLLVEDLASDGKSKAKFVEALRKAGGVVDHSFVVFEYGIYKRIHKTMDDLGVSLHSLCTWWDMLKAARDSGYFEKRTLDEVEKFLKSPEKWSAAHGGTTGEAA
jgi:orotate phosphoribosyltransferase